MFRMFNTKTFKELFSLSISEKIEMKESGLTVLFSAHIPEE